MNLNAIISCLELDILIMLDFGSSEEIFGELAAQKDPIFVFVPQKIFQM